MRIENTLAAAIPNDMTREDVSRAAGISRVYLQQLIAGDKTPSVYIALKLAAVLGKSVEILFRIRNGNADSMPKFRRMRR